MNFLVHALSVNLASLKGQCISLGLWILNLQYDAVYDKTYMHGYILIKSVYGSIHLQIIRHFLGSWEFRLPLMLLEVSNTSMSTPKVIMYIEISRQATSYLIVASGQRFKHSASHWCNMYILCIHVIHLAKYVFIPSLHLDFRFWIGKTCWKKRWGRSIDNQSCWHIRLSGSRVSDYL